MFHYLDGGADDERSLDRNTSAFDDYEILPRQLRDVSRIDLQTTLFGCRLDWPVMLSPTGANKLFHADGELGVARNAERFGTVYSLSSLGSETIEAVADATQGPKLYQVYMFRDRGLTREWIERCKAAGYAALALTVDTPVPGNRERDFVYGFAAQPRSRLRQAASFLRHPYWLWRALGRREIEMINIADSDYGKENLGGRVRYFVDSELDRSLTFADVEWLASHWGGPLAVKGVQTVADCRKAADSGATAVMLSNHGGRQLDTSPAPVDCIAAVADALHDRLEIICDGGVRRGNHVVKALALGARACSIGRAYLYPLAAGGEAGVQRGLQLLRDEVERTMALCGCRSVAEIGPQSVRRRYAGDTPATSSPLKTYPEAK